METITIIGIIKKDLTVLKSQGHDSIAIDSLQDYLTNLQKTSPSSVEQQKIEHEKFLACFDAQIKSNIEMFKSVIEAGKEALNAALLINGGAVIAILGFLGAMASKGTSGISGLASFPLPLFYFCSGVLAAACGFGARYAAQHHYHNKMSKIGNRFNNGSIFLAMAAYATFFCGVYEAYRGFLSIFGK